MPAKTKTTRPRRPRREKVNFSISPETRGRLERILDERPDLSSIGRAIDWCVRVATEPRT